MDIVTIESGAEIIVQINDLSPVVKPLMTDIVIENVTERGYTGAQGEQGLQGIQGPIGPQGVPGTGFSQINTPLIPTNSSYELDELDTSLYSGCLWIVTAIDPLANLYRTGVINATHNSWSHYAIVGDSVLYRLTVDNLVLSVTNNHANPITLSVIRLPTTKP